MAAYGLPLSFHMMTILSRAAIIACAVAVSLSAQAPEQAKSSRVQIRYASFDPLRDAPEVPASLRSTTEQQLRIVQFAGIPTEAGRRAIQAVGGKIIGYLPSNSYVARMTVDQAEQVRTISSRGVLPFTADCGAE